MRSRLVAAGVVALMVLGGTVAYAAAYATDVACKIEGNVLSCPLPEPPAPVTETATVAPDPVTVTVTASPAPSTAESTSASPSPTSESSPSPTPATTSAPPTTTPPAPSAFPDATNTGYRNAPGYPGSLKACSLPIKSNTTYSFCDFGYVGVGSSSVPVSNVKFIGCRFKDSGGALTVLFGTNISFEWSSFEPDVAAPPTAYSKGYQYGISADGAYGSFARGLTLDHVDMWGFANAVNVSYSTQAQPVVVRNSWIHDARDDNNGQDHTDGIGELNGSSMSYVVIDHNTIESKGNTNGIAFQYGRYSDFTVTNNLIGGWGYSVAIGAQGPGPNTRITFTGNVFSTRIPAHFGPTYPANFWSGNGNRWRENKWQSTDQHNGKFWTPSGPATTDYIG